MTRKNRVEIPTEIAAKVLFDSNRTCCVCRKPGRPVQIHHLDGNPSNSAIENLVVLCLDCHRETQICGGFDRKLDAAQILMFRQDWVQRVASTRNREHGTIQTPGHSGQAVPAIRYLQMKESSEEYRYLVEADYPEVNSEDANADEETNLCINTFVTRTLQQFRADAIARAADKSDERAAMPGRAALAGDSLSISHKIAFFTNRGLSIEFTLWTYYAGAAHPNHRTRTLNFRLRPSFQLELDDLFKPSTNYLEILSKFSLDRLKEQKAAWAEPGTAPEYRNFQCFVFAPDGIRIFFDEYSVSCYADGRYEVLVPLDVVAPVLKESVAALLS